MTPNRVSPRQRDTIGHPYRSMIAEAVSEEVSIQTKRTELKRSYVNGQTDIHETSRLRVLRLTARTPDGPLALDLPTASPGEITAFEEAARN